MKIMCIVLAVLCVGCASQPSSQPLSQPSWWPNPPEDEQVYYAVGFVQMPNEADAWKKAATQARANLSNQIESRIISKQNAVRTESGDVFESIIIQLTSVVLRGAYIIKRAIGPNNTYYVLIACRKDYVEERIDNLLDAELFFSKMIRVQGGTFTMGSPTSEAGRRDNEGPQHRVTVNSFFMGKYEVTAEEFRRFVNASGYTTDAERNGGGNVWNGKEWETKADATWKNPYIVQGDDHPVVMVSWNDAVEYCNWRSSQEGLTPAYTISGSGDNRRVDWNRSANGYRLPTEAEWEYACRAGTTTPYSSGNSVDTAGWYWNNSGTHPVGQKRPNAWGLYDMHGNVWEWCWDWYGAYSSGSQTDPVGASSGSNRVVRGGSWTYYGQDLRSAYRGIDTPLTRSNGLGFRLLRP